MYTCVQIWLGYDIISLLLNLYMYLVGLVSAGFLQNSVCIVIDILASICVNFMTIGEGLSKI